MNNHIQFTTIDGKIISLPITEGLKVKGDYGTYVIQNDCTSYVLTMNEAIRVITEIYDIINGRN